LVASVWGLIPRWAKDRSMASKTFNARAETLAERPTFRPLIGTHRCVIPVSGFYEWQGRGKGKTPLYIHRAGGGPLALAGLWAEWEDPESGEPVTSHTVITCAANDFMQPIHDRMPVILSGETLNEWLDPAIDRPADVLPLLVPAPDDLLTAYAVAPLVNNVRNDSPELIRPIAG
jgi:putative SOS response-associated peptidase YedK